MIAIMTITAMYSMNCKKSMRVVGLPDNLQVPRRSWEGPGRSSEGPGRRPSLRSTRPGGMHEALKFAIYTCVDVVVFAVACWIKPVCVIMDNLQRMCIAVLLIPGKIIRRLVFPKYDIN